MIAPCVSLWIGPELGPFEQACLLSALRQGHAVALYCYREPAGLPRGVEVRDAALILPETAIVRHRTGSPSLFSNLFRYELMRRGLGTWIDCDAYLLKPMPDADPYLFGWQEEGVINGGVLRMPPDSPMLAPLIGIFSEREVPRWLPAPAKLAAYWRLLLRGRTGLSQMPWGSAGPHALTAIARETGLDRLAVPREVLYPVPWQQADWLFRPDRSLEDVTTRASVSVHLWTSCLRRLGDMQVQSGSFAARLAGEAQAAARTLVPVARSMVPPLSVVMPVHNALPYVDEAISSIVKQSFGDFELVLADDGSTDGSSERLRHWGAKDSRIRVERREAKSGLAGSANWAASLAQAPIVARMDADDIARPDRLRRQFEEMRRQPDIALLGTLADSIDASGRRVRAPDYSRLFSAPFPPFPHSSIMYRRAAYERAGGYRAGAEPWEDLDLFLRIAECERIAVLAEPLVSIRHSPASSRLRDGIERYEAAMARMYRCMAAYIADEDYTPLLGQGGPAPSAHPMVFVACGYQMLWNGRSPGQLRRMLASDALRADWESLRALAWVLWGTASPRTLRLALRTRLAVRNLTVRLRLDGSIVDWQPKDARRLSGPLCT
jgi:hypothetical protein